MTATDRQCLERAVLADPHDDAPRLVLADILDEAGGADRALFIRTQIALADQRDPARRPPASEANDRLQDRLTLRAKRLMKRWVPGRNGCNALHWLGELGKLNPFANISKKRNHTGWLGRVGAGPRRPGHPSADSVYATFRRGFVDEVALPLRAFVGGVCPDCRGHGRHADHSEAECTACGGKTGTGRCGTGRVGGLAAALFAAHPVTRVRLTDRVVCEDNSWWRRAPGETTPDPDDLPHFLFDLLSGGHMIGKRSEDRDEWSHSYGPGEDATVSLSDACVVYGRRLAGLPPVPSVPAPAAVG